MQVIDTMVWAEYLKKSKKNKNLSEIKIISLEGV